MATILIVDDLTANREFLVKVLHDQGHRLVEAADGRAGLAAVRAEHPDLVITDVLMPVMDGYEFVKQLRGDPATSAIPVLFYTAPYGEREARAFALSDGVPYVLTKPVEAQQVLTIVGRVLAGEPAAEMAPPAAPVPPAFDREHLRLLTGKLSKKAGDLRTANARLRALINVGLELASEQDPGRLLQRACVAAHDLFCASYVTLGILDRPDGAVHHLVTCGTGAGGWIKAGGAVPGIFRTVVADRQTMRGTNPGGDPASLQLPVLHPVVETYLAAPIASPTRVYGWLCLCRNDGRSFTEDDDHLVMAMSAQVGRLYEKLSLAEVAQKRAEELEHEILERQQAEEALRKSDRLNRNLVEHLPHRILVKDRHSVLLFCNANYATDLGLPLEDVIGKNAFDFYPRDLAEAYNADDKEVMASGITKNVEEPYQVGGQQRWVHTVKVPYRDEQEQVIGVLVVFEDITERRILEAQFQQAQKMEAIGQLAAGIAHDFNNLLTVILGFCELLLADADPDDPHQADMRQIQKAGGRAAGLTRQLLAFSRKQIIEPTRLNLNVVVTDMRPMLGRLIREDVTLTLNLGPQLAPVKADRGQVEQIVMNLAVNAQDAMPRGGTLTIETANVELDEQYATTHVAVKSGPYVALTVTDTGTGMTPQVQARLFEPFFTTKEVGKGTGLGLATVHGIVARSGGSVGFYSEVGRGTAFKVYFPRADAAEMVGEAPLLVARPAGTETVLVVEDADGLRELTRRLLQRQGYTVLVAANADEAFELFEQNPSIDIVLTDVVMPGASGPELTNRLVDRRPGLKVIYMSGYTDEAIVQHGVLKPGIAFLQKPFTSEALGRKIREVLDR